MGFYAKNPESQQSNKGMSKVKTDRRNLKPEVDEMSGTPKTNYSGTPTMAMT